MCDNIEKSCKLAEDLEKLNKFLKINELAVNYDETIISATIRHLTKYRELLYHFDALNNLFKYENSQKIEENQFKGRFKGCKTLADLIDAGYQLYGC